MADEKEVISTGEEEVKWERWQKKRIFVRELSGVYGDLYKDLYAQPRIYKSKDTPTKGGPMLFGQKNINPQVAKIIQAFESHIETLSPGAWGQRHYHVNSAVFFILQGKGYDVHNGYRVDWEAGDSAIVENSCVHQHFNADPEKPATMLVFKAKPTFGFNNMTIQKNIVYPPTVANPGFEDFKPVGYGEYSPLNFEKS